ncbi:Starch-binding associating with outer membrane [Chitinophaga sp. CF118]|uniref:RagB/SusD family nutrient uptake outer membrane protein n=1 Tax=Chitinophaga sp. CF118 TaxID=1884367 RepID=UPI0008EA7C1A|nr:RagB/SusD family nutrient uptake outer membrane protein [Chitinophaga sp. CF118]SFE01390.1 Starch-binding associating with outer membrane [Chitinophaga sp. CF118]
MNKRLLHKSYTVILLASIMIASSCSKILDLEPHNSTFTDAYFTNEQDANTALAGAYAILRNVLMTDNCWHMYGDVAAGEFKPDGNYDAGAIDVASGNYIGGNAPGGLRNWQKFYKLLQQVNLIIDKVPGIDDNKFLDTTAKRHVIGEAYFLRAFTYFYMSRIWGDVPLKLAPDLNADEAKNIPRSPADSVLMQCLADLEIAKGALDFGYTDGLQRAVRANKGSVFALEAHIKAWKGDYAGSEIAANEVITKGGYQLVDSANYMQIFIGRSMEGIFEVNINDGQSEGIALNRYEGGYNAPANVLMDPFIDGKSTIAWPLNNTYLSNIYRESGDIRFEKFFYQAGSDKGQTIKYANITYADGSGKKQPRMANNMNIFRLADIILLRAEALNKLGRDPEAIVLLNQVRNRAGVPDYDGSVDLASVILEERMRELFYEGQSYYDLVRTKKLSSFSPVSNIGYNENFTDGMFMNGSPLGGWLWPIDNDMFRDDFTLKQTPYWQGKY